MRRYGDDILALALEVHMGNTGSLQTMPENHQEARAKLQQALSDWNWSYKCAFDTAVYNLVQIALEEQSVFDDIVKTKPINKGFVIQLNDPKLIQNHTAEKLYYCEESMQYWTTDKNSATIYKTKEEAEKKISKWLEHFRVVSEVVSL